MKLVTLLLNNKPIRKVVAAAIASAIVFLAHRLHISVGSKEVTDAVSVALPVVVAYFTPDPRVQ